MFFIYAYSRWKRIALPHNDDAKETPLRHAIQVASARIIKAGNLGATELSIAAAYLSRRRSQQRFAPVRFLLGT